MGKVLGMELKTFISISYLLVSPSFIKWEVILLLAYLDSCRKGKIDIKLLLKNPF